MIKFYKSRVNLIGTCDVLPGINFACPPLLCFAPVSESGRVVTHFCNCLLLQFSSSARYFPLLAFKSFSRMRAESFGSKAALPHNGSESAGQYLLKLNYRQSDTDTRQRPLILRLLPVLLLLVVIFTFFLARCSSPTRSCSVLDRMSLFERRG